MEENSSPHGHHVKIGAERGIGPTAPFEDVPSMTESPPVGLAAQSPTIPKLHHSGDQTLNTQAFRGPSRSKPKQHERFERKKKTDLEMDSMIREKA